MHQKRILRNENTKKIRNNILRVVDDLLKNNFQVIGGNFERSKPQHLAHKATMTSVIFPLCNPTGN